MEQKLKLKKKVKQDSKQKSIQRLALTAVQKHLQVLQLRSWLVTIGLITGAAALRVPMQVIPNAEPLTFFAILTGWLFGKKKGLIAGASALFISNFLVFGGQGPWLIPQLIAFGFAGFLGGFLRKKATVLETLLVMTVATIFGQLILNIGWGIISGIGLLAIVSGLPFLIPALIGNIIFALFLPMSKKFVDKKGQFNEIEICKNIMKKHKIKNKQIQKVIE